MTSPLDCRTPWSSPLARLGRAAFRFVFPPTCPLCHRSTVSGSWLVENRLVTPVLCHSCVAEVAPSEGNRCQRCGVPLGPFINSANGCSNCRRRKYRFSQVVRFGLYDGKLREACIRGKAPFQQPLSAALANLLWVAERERFAAVKADLIVPVPRFWTRRVLQEHHSADTIAEVLSQRLKLPLRRNLLRKVRLTPDQSDLAGPQRRKNLHDAFRVWFPRGQLDRKTVLLVDDILTTGTTANECARALLKAGASQVVVAVLAVVPPAGSRSMTPHSGVPASGT